MDYEKYLPPAVAARLCQHLGQNLEVLRITAYCESISFRRHQPAIASKFSTWTWIVRRRQWSRSSNGGAGSNYPGGGARGACGGVAPPNGSSRGVVEAVEHRRRHRQLQEHLVREHHRLEHLEDPEVVPMDKAH